MKKFNSARDELLFIYKKNNFCSPEKVVQFAENPETHLHAKFEWDNEKASHEYRIWQARQIISLEFNIIKNGETEQETRLFISLKDDRKKEGGYRLMTEVLKDKDLRQKLLNEALTELIRIKTKYGHLIELTKVFIEIEKLQEAEIAV